MAAGDYAVIIHFYNAPAATGTFKIKVSTGAVGLFDMEEGTSDAIPFATSLLPAATFKVEGGSTINLGKVMNASPSTVTVGFTVSRSFKSIDDMATRVIMPVANYHIMKDTTNWPSATMFPVQAHWDTMTCSIKLDSVAKVTDAAVVSGYAGKGMMAVDCPAGTSLGAFV